MAATLSLVKLDVGARDAERVQRVLDTLNEAHAAGKIKSIIVVAFGPDNACDFFNACIDLKHMAYAGAVLDIELKKDMLYQSGSTGMGA